ncbi:MAG: ABC transporter permease, partial [Kutzneria sp.]|nr:ABC transporter permease [Kutzneria sp.]
MIKTTLAGLRARTARMVLSSIAIVLGVAFISGTLIIGNALDASIHNDFARQARGVDVSVRPQGHTPAFTEDTVERIRELPGVAAADGRTAVLVPLVGTDGRAKPVEVSSLEDAASLREFDIVDGQFPRQANEIAVEAGSARTLKLSIGHKVTVLDKDDKSVPMTVVGTYSQGASAFALSGDHAVMPASAMLSLTDVTGFDQIVATAAAGTSEQQVADRVRAALAGSDVKVQTGAQLTTETLEQAGQGSTALTQFMLVFALIALIVASMVIYNTFTILVAQRS